MRILVALHVGRLALLGDGLIARALLIGGLGIAPVLLAEALLIALLGRHGLLGIVLGEALLIGLLVRLLIRLLCVLLGIALGLRIALRLLIPLGLGITLGLLVTLRLGIALGLLVASAGLITRRLRGLLVTIGLALAIPPTRRVSIVRTAVIHPYTFTFLPHFMLRQPFILQAVFRQKTCR